MVDAIEISQDWFDHPVVRHAVRRAGWGPNQDAAQLLFALSDVLNELEDLVPGMSFTHMLSSVSDGASVETRIELQKRLSAGGLGPREAALAVGLDVTPGATTAEKSAQTERILELMRPLVLTDAEIAEIVGRSVGTIQTVRSHHGLYLRKDWRSRERRDPKRSMEIYQAVLDTGTKAGAARKLGISHKTVAAAVNHVERMQAAQRSVPA